MGNAARHIFPSRLALSRQQARHIVKRHDQIIAGISSTDIKQKRLRAHKALCLALSRMQRAGAGNNCHKFGGDYRKVTPF